MDVETVSLSVLAKKILKLLPGKAALEGCFTSISKGQFDGVTLDSFFAVLQELKASGLVVLKEDYTYTPYERFGDRTTKQYAKLDIYLKLA